jgi:hypothetical protein
MPISISKNSGASVYEIRNFENLHTGIAVPVIDISDITGDDQDGMLTVIEGPCSTIEFDWVVLDESSSVVTGTGSPVTTAIAQHAYLTNTFMPNGANQILDSYTITLDFCGGSTFSRDGRLTDIDLVMTGNEPLTWKAHAKFIVGTVQ